MVHIRPRYVIVALAGLALAGCGARGNQVLAVRTAAQPIGQLAAAVTAGKQRPPDPSWTCPAQLAASWTDNGASVAVNVNAPSGTSVAVSVEAATTLVEETAATRGGALTFSFPVPGAQVNRVRIRHNEAGCEVQQRSAAG